MATEEPERLLNDLNPSIDEFLCRALRGESAPWSALDAAISADEFQQRCHRHGVLSLLYHSMREQQEWQSWPLDLQNALTESSKSDVAREMLRAHNLQKLLSAFSGRGLPYLLTKGEALANTIYAMPGTRTRSDSDLFIPIEGISRARKAVVDAGFVIVSPVYKSHQFTVRRAGGAPDIFEFDVHWRILNAPRYARTLTFGEAHGRSVEVPGMEQVRTLQPADALLLACVHRVGSDLHDPNRLIWIFDIHLLVSGMTQSQLTDFAESAVNRNVQKACLDGLNMSRERFATTISGKVLEFLATPEAPLTLARRYAQSNLGLLVDDWKQLPDSDARRALLRELFLPSGDSLLHKYGKKERLWLPLLYVRHVLSGLTQRLTLR